jgi:hypothetical protein
MTGSSREKLSNFINTRKVLRKHYQGRQHTSQHLSKYKRRSKPKNAVTHLIRPYKSPTSNETTLLWNPKDKGSWKVSGDSNLQLLRATGTDIQNAVMLRVLCSMHMYRTMRSSC